MTKPYLAVNNPINTDAFRTVMAEIVIRVQCPVCDKWQEHMMKNVNEFRCCEGE